MEATLLAGTLSGTVAIVVGLFFVYFLLIFFLGLMFYYFTGNKPGEKMLANLARVFGRLYSQTWMIFTMFLGMIGLQYFLKALMGGLFEGFVYTTSRYSANLSWQTDLKTGVILAVFAVIVFFVHWGFNFLIETKEEKSGKVIMNKIFNGTGLVLSSLVFFFSLLLSITQLIEYVADADSSLRPGATLATFMASFPVWLFYVLKTIWMVRKEK